MASLREYDVETIIPIDRFITDKGFPCTGAKTALARGQIVTFEAGLMDDPSRDAAMLSAIYRFIAGYEQDGELFRSFMINFADRDTMTEEMYEAKFWNVLSRLHRLDMKTHEWDPAVSSAPDSPSFSYSLGGKAFYAVGMHPGSSRKARRMPQPTIVLNLHDQFERLRNSGQYNAMKQVIRRRDVAYSGSTNPMLDDFGATSEARQYSGRKVDDSWKCPFHALH